MAHIVVVDDSPTDVHLVKTSLEDAGHEVTTATSAAEGIELTRNLQPGLVLMDVVFEGSSGFQAVRRLSRDDATNGIPVIIISGKGLESDRAWGLRQGAVDYLVKPLKPKVLLEAVTKALEEHGAT